MKNITGQPIIQTSDETNILLKEKWVKNLLKH